MYVNSHTSGKHMCIFINTHVFIDVCEFTYSFFYLRCIQVNICVYLCLYVPWRYAGAGGTCSERTWATRGMQLVCIYAHMLYSMYAWLYVCMHVCMYVCLCVYRVWCVRMHVLCWQLYVYIYIYIYIYVCIYTNTYIHKHRHRQRQTNWGNTYTCICTHTYKKTQKKVRCQSATANDFR
jgi:hypothetical protein